jgi:hypothetical protein
VDGLLGLWRMQRRFQKKRESPDQATGEDD